LIIGTQCHERHDNGTRRQYATPCYRRAVSNRPATGRPAVTTHTAIEQAAFRLFDDHGFETTTMSDIAAAVGVGRRTLFRYYPSKNDILWGQFDEGLHDFASTFASMPQRVSLVDAIVDAIVAFNTFDEHATVQHRQRMQLLLGTPALLAHSELRYSAWRDVVAEYVALRVGGQPSDLIPSLAGRMALSVALTAYEQWLLDDGRTLPDLIRQAGSALIVLTGSRARLR
jgi:mycofactocin system transcriptional regulator